MKLNEEQKNRVVKSIQNAEAQTSGEIRVHLSYADADYDLMAHAKKQFLKLGMNRTKNHNGILLYLNPKIRKFAVYGDEGIHQKVGQAFWNELVTEVGQAIRNQDMVEGIVHAVNKMGTALKSHYPFTTDGTDELKNDVSESN